MTTILVIDDNEIDRERVRRHLRGWAEVQEAATGEEGLRACAARPPDCVLLDHRLPDVDGVDLIGAMRAYGAAVVMLSGQGSEQLAVTAMKRGAHDYLPKDGLTDEHLKSAVRHALRDRDRQAALDATENRLQLLVDQLPCVVWTTDRQPIVTSVAGADVAGLFTNARVGQAPWPNLEEAHGRALRTSAPARVAIEHVGRQFEAEVRPLRDSRGAVTGLVGVAIDVTERRNLEDQLRHAQKMDAIGKLAGGVAHDFNNLLTSVVGFTTFALDELPAGHAARADLEEVLRGAGRATELTRQLLAVARRRPSEAELVRPHELLGAMLKMVGRLIGSAIEIKTRMPGELWSVSIDPSWFEQIVLNLAVNARDAMPTGGQLYLELANVELKEPMFDARGERAEPGCYVRLLVADTGSGMSAEVVERIFDPFFTTKRVGEGTGLGLATVYGIVRQLGGLVQVYTEPGQGSAFRVLIPAERDGVPVAPPPVRQRILTGDARVLVVEDDGQIQALAIRTLESAGYRVSLAGDGATALQLLGRARPDEPFELLLADVVTPGMNVTELIAVLRARQDPVLRTALMTGWSPHALRADILAGLPVLEKPFAPKTLLQFVREVLDPSPPT